MEVEEVKIAAQGMWDSILRSLAPQLREALERPGHHVPCPVHGGKDGYRTFPDVAETGGGVCNTCGVHADGFATLMWASGMNFKEALGEVVGYLQLGTTRPLPARVVKREKTSDEREDEKLRQSLNRVWNESI